MDEAALRVTTSESDKIPEGEGFDLRTSVPGPCVARSLTDPGPWSEEGVLLGDVPEARRP